MKKKCRFFVFVTPWEPIGSLNKFQLIWSSRLDNYSKHINIHSYIWARGLLFREYIRLDNYSKHINIHTYIWARGLLFTEYIRQLTMLLFTLHELYDSGECFVFLPDKTENKLWSLNLRRAQITIFQTFYVILFCG